MTLASTGISEEWRPVLGYEGCYEVSNLGGVRSLIAKRPLLVLSQYLRPDGYRQVQLKVRQRPKNCLVHVLVEEAFNGPREPGLQVNHIDGDKQNNVLSNLERLTRVENVRHAWATGLCGDRKGERNTFARITKGIVRSIRAEAEGQRQPNGRIKRGICKAIAEKYGIARSTASGILRGESWSHVK